MTKPVRLGILGAADIAPRSLVGPARSVPEVEIAAVAARDRGRAEHFAAMNGIPVVHDDYEDLISDPDVDAVYNVTPNGLHGRWTAAAVRAGKHVLCEKPFAANAAEARAVAEAARDTGLVIMEGFHYRYHPLIARALDVIQSGEIGVVRSIATGFGAPGKPPDNIRWNLELAGGALMDIGCYPIHLIRTLGGAEPRVVAAEMITASADIDADAAIELRFPAGVTGTVKASMLPEASYYSYAHVVGEAGELDITEPFMPHKGHELVVRSPNGVRRETESLEPTYVFQLRSFADAILSGTAVLTGPTDSIANMDVIDASYRAAGLNPRHPTAQ